MVFVTHLLEHMGVPSGAAIAIVVTGKKFLKGGPRSSGGRATVTGMMMRVVVIEDDAKLADDLLMRDGLRSLRRGRRA
jgi:hypothetical protein